MQYGIIFDLLLVAIKAESEFAQKNNRFRRVIVFWAGFGSA
jgi:hypothetical protein